MEPSFEGMTDGQLLAVVDAALDALDDHRLRLPSDHEQCELLKESLRVGARFAAWQQQLAAQVEAAEAAWHEHGTSTSTWLADVGNLTRGQAGRLVKAGLELRRFPIIAAATAAGGVLPVQAEAITRVLGNLPEEFPTEVVDRAQKLMVGFAATYNSTELSRLTGHLLEVLAPEVAESLEATRLEREERTARRNRFLEFRADGHGSVLLRGSLPIVAAEPLIQLVDTYAAAEKRAVDVLDPQAEYVTSAMRRADGLVALVHHHSQQALAPANGGDRPRVVLTLSYDTLARQARAAGLLGTRCPGGATGEPEVCAAGGAPAGGVAVPAFVPVGTGGRIVGSDEPVPAGVLRQLLCDADLLPAVLGGASEILDVGRTQRLVTPPIRAALEIRDGGCAFPGCEKPPRACHAHHILPWWAGGETSLENLVLVCAHHHGIVEPGHDPTADRWAIRLRHDGIPEVVPPRRVDPARRPRLHTRFHPRTAPRPASRA